MYFWLFIIATAIWVLFDAKSIGVRKGLIDGMGNMGPWSWAIVTLLLWIVGFPMYLYCRGKFKAAIAAEKGDAIPSTSHSLVQSTSGSIDDLEKLGLLKEKNLITEAEFNAKKKQILGI